MNHDKLMVALLGAAGMMGRARQLGYASLPFYYPTIPYRPTIYKGSCLPSECDAVRNAGIEPTTDWKALVNETKWDVLEVATPNELHHEMCMEALEATKKLGKKRTIIVEKPLATSFAQAKEMYELAETIPNLLCSCNFIYRHVAINAFFRNLILSGAYGPVIEFEFRYAQSWGRNAEYSWRFGPFGGCLADLGSHACDMASFLTGERPTEVAAVAATYIPERFKPAKQAASDIRRYENNVAQEREGEMVKVEVDDAARILMKMPNGVFGTISCTRNQCGAQNTFSYTICCRDATFKWNFDRLSEGVMVDERTGETKTYGGSTTFTADQTEFPYAIFAPGHGVDYRALTANFLYENVRAFAGLAPVSPLATFKDAMEVERTLEATKKSICENRWVRLSEIN